MMRRVLSMLRKDVRVGRRDSMVMYLLLVPFLLALLGRLVLSVLEGGPLVFAATRDVDLVVLTALGERGRLELLDDEAALLRRVRAIDDVPGFLPGAAGTEVVLEGNEVPYVVEAAESIVDVARWQAAGTAPRLEVDSLGETRTPLRAMAGALLAFSVMVVGGLVVGFSMLDEKESGTVRAYAVAPLRFSEYLMAKLVYGGTAAGALALGATWVLLGGELPLGPFLLAILASLPVGLLLGLIVGTFAQEQLGAVALLKSLLFVFVSLPVAGFAVEGAWGWVLAPFANHHAVQALFAALTGGPLARPAWLAWGLGMPLLCGLVWEMRRRLFSVSSR